VNELELPERDIVGVRAPNLSRFGITGPNSWVVGRDPAWLVDPGPAVDEHLGALVIELLSRGGLAGIALTHDHWDHSAAVPALRARFPGAPLAAARGKVDVQLEDGADFGPLRVIATPGHARDHLAFLTADVAITGDAVLGEGSVFVAPYPGAMVSYIEGLQRLRALSPAFICPGHGPLVRDADGKLGDYIAHRLDRERRLLAALDAGKRTVDQLLDEAWAGTPAALRPAAAATMAAHLDKLADEGRLPDGVERPQVRP
jgi:glyoxylase-like metal-dependent hydrolase (beta-lactamase superfamily II)